MANASPTFPCPRVRWLRRAALAPLLLAATGAVRAQGASPARPREPIISLPCEGCEAVFEGLPDSLTSTARIAPPGEPGVPLRIEGTVYDRSGHVAPGVIVYAYHTNARGVYPPNEQFRGRAAYRHGLLRGWARTDDSGRYRFDTIRPGSYPGRDNPAHVHMHIIEPGCCTYYIASIRFTDDPLISREQREQALAGHGPIGLERPEPDGHGGWIVHRDIVLGEGLAHYPPDTSSEDPGRAAGAAKSRPAMDGQPGRDLPSGWH